MSKAKDFEQNETILHQLVDTLPGEVAAVVGMHALVEMAHTTNPEKFAEFIQNAIQEAQQTHTAFQTAQQQSSSSSAAT